MGGHISKKWYAFTTGDPGIDHCDWVYRLVIENVDRCGSADYPAIADWE